MDMSEAEKRLKAEIDTINNSMDRFMKLGQNSGMMPIDVAMLDRLVRPAFVSMAVHRAAGTESSAFVNSILWALGVILTELVCRTHDVRNNSVDTPIYMDAIMEQLRNEFYEGIQANAEKMKPH